MNVNNNYSSGLEKSQKGIGLN